MTKGMDWDKVRRERAGAKAVHHASERYMELKFGGKCLVCKQSIPAGQWAFYSKPLGVWHDDCTKPDIAQKKTRRRRRRKRR